MQSYVIRRTFLLPLGLLLLASLALFVLCLVQGEVLAKIVMLGILLLPLTILFVECAVRRVEIGAETLSARRLLRVKTLRFADITAVDTVEVRRRVFLTLSAGDDFLILSNAYARFPELASALLARVPNQIVSEETRTMAAAPPAKNGDIVSCWIATAVMIGIIVIQLGRPH